MTAEVRRENLPLPRMGIHEIPDMCEQILLMMVDRTRPGWDLRGISAFTFDISKELSAGIAQIYAERSSSFGIGLLRPPYRVRTRVPSVLVESEDDVRFWNITDEFSFGSGSSDPFPLDLPFKHALEHDDPIDLRLERMKSILDKVIKEGLEGWMGTMNLEIPMVLTPER